ncbi:hypothetical protein LXL04_027602 [Taraxacum kok-saghyz]
MREFHNAVDEIDDEVDGLEVINSDVFESAGLEEDMRKRMLKNLNKKVACSSGEVHIKSFFVGQNFKIKKEVKEHIKLLAIHSKRDLHIAKNEKIRVRVVCRGIISGTDGESDGGPSINSKVTCKGKKESCPFVIQISRSNEVEPWLVKTVNDKHLCLKTRNVKACTSKFLAGTLLQQLDANPKIPVTAIHDELQRKYELGLSKMKVFRAKAMAKEQIFRRHCIVQKAIEKCIGTLTPTATALVYSIKEEASKYKAIFCGSDKYQVSGMMLEQFVVNLREKTCTCRYWEIIGIICKHAVCAIWDKILNGENAQEPEQWVHPCYRLDTWKAMYFNKIDPINGRSMWPKSVCPTTLVAPKHHIQTQKKKRRRAADEPKNQTRKLSRKFLTVTCGKCHNKGHNSRTCKGQGGPRQRTVVGSSQGVGGSSQVGSSQGVGGSSQVGSSQGVGGSSQAAAKARQKIPFQRPRARG